MPGAIYENTLQLLLAVAAAHKQLFWYKQQTRGRKKNAQMFILIVVQKK